MQTRCRKFGVGYRPHVKTCKVFRQTEPPACCCRIVNSPSKLSTIRIDTWTRALAPACWWWVNRRTKKLLSALWRRPSTSASAGPTTLETSVHLFMPISLLHFLFETLLAYSGSLFHFLSALPSLFLFRLTDMDSTISCTLVRWHPQRYSVLLTWLERHTVPKNNRAGVSNNTWSLNSTFLTSVNCLSADPKVPCVDRPHEHAEVTRGSIWLPGHFRIAPKTFSFKSLLNTKRLKAFSRQNLGLVFSVFLKIDTGYHRAG